MIVLLVPFASPCFFLALESADVSHTLLGDDSEWEVFYQMQYNHLSSERPKSSLTALGWLTSTLLKMLVPSCLLCSHITQFLCCWFLMKGLRGALWVLGVQTLIMNYIAQLGTFYQSEINFAFSPGKLNASSLSSLMLDQCPPEQILRNIWIFF